jgi:hypothetical protein
VKNPSSRNDGFFTPTKNVGVQNDSTLNLKLTPLEPERGQQNVRFVESTGSKTAIWIFGAKNEGYAG